MTDEASATPMGRAGIGHPGVRWSGDGALTGRVEEAVQAAGGLSPASVRRRAAGFVIDTLVLAALLSAIALLFAGVDSDASQEEIQRQVEDFSPLLYLVQFFYNLTWNTIGWSPGKRLLRMRTVDIDGARPGLRRGLVRTLGSILSGFLGLGYVWAVWDSEHRTWHDRIAKTYVIEVPANEGRFRE